MRALAQTTDGYLRIGTTTGLIRLMACGSWPLLPSAKVVRCHPGRGGEGPGRSAAVTHTIV